MTSLFLPPTQNGGPHVVPKRLVFLTSTWQSSCHLQELLQQIVVKVVLSLSLLKVDAVRVESSSALSTTLTHKLGVSIPDKDTCLCISIVLLSNTSTFPRHSFLPRQTIINHDDYETTTNSKRRIRNTIAAAKAFCSNHVLVSAATSGCSLGIYATRCRPSLCTNWIDD